MDAILLSSLKLLNDRMVPRAGRITDEKLLDLENRDNCIVGVDYESLVSFISRVETQNLDTEKTVKIDNSFVRLPLHTAITALNLCKRISESYCLSDTFADRLQRWKENIFIP